MRPLRALVFALALSSAGCAGLWGFDDLAVGDSGNAAPQDASVDRGDSSSEDAVAADAHDVGADAPSTLDSPTDSGVVGDSACDVMHTDGLGQTWTDCAPVGTYNAIEATAACESNAEGGPCVSNTCGGDASPQAICDVDPHFPGYCTCWGFSGPSAGHVNNTATCSNPSEANCGGGDTWN